LPLATDTILIDAVARRVAEKLDAYCLPTLPYSISHMHRGNRGTVWLRNSTLAAVIRDIAVSVRHEGFKEFVILNGHGGNFILTPVVQDLNLDFPDLLTMTFDGWEMGEKAKMFKNIGGLTHADEFETSCILYLCEEAVRRDKFRKQTAEPDRELLRYLPFKEFSKLTHTGDPSQATADLGRRAVEAMTESCVTRIQASLRKMTRHRKSK
jgi:creatinine amidohydrolase